MRFERVLPVGTKFRERHHGQRLVHAAPIGRTHGRTDQKAHHRKKTLANGEPSTHGERRKTLKARIDRALSRAFANKISESGQSIRPTSAARYAQRET